MKRGLRHAGAGGAARVVVAGGGEVRLEGQGISIVLESAAAVGLASDGRVSLDRGTLRS